MEVAWLGLAFSGISEKKRELGFFLSFLASTYR